MPIILHVDELEPGMRLTQTIYRDGQTLIAAGKVLEEWEINTLGRKYPNLTVRIGDPVLDEWVEFEDDSDNQETATTVYRRMAQVMTNVREKLSAHTALEASDIIGLQSVISAVINYINEHPITAAMLVHFGDLSSYLQQHSANVFYLSMLVGNAIREYMYRQRGRDRYQSRLATQQSLDLTPLALGCLFHDIGMIPIEYLLTPKDPLSAEDQEKIRQHPMVGAKILPADFMPLAKKIIRTHHENFDGTGYPEAIPGENQHIFTRLIRIADAYDAGTTDRVYQQAKSPARVLWEMSFGPNRSQYDPIIVKMLMSLVQPFPIGAKVRLNRGGYGVVVRHNRKHPFRPVVIIAFDEAGNKLKKRDLRAPIDLAQNDDVRIINFINEDLSFLNDASNDEEWTDPQLNGEEMNQTLLAAADA